MNKPVKLGIFDIDGTIFRSSLAVEMIHLLIEQGIFPKKAGLEIEADYQHWLNRTGSYEAYLNQLITVFAKYINGIEVKKVLKIANQVLVEQKNHNYRYTKNLVETLKKKNYHLVAISGSPDFLVSEFAKFLGFNASYGTHIEVVDGKFINKFIVGDRNKISLVYDYLTKNNLKADFKNSIAVGDTLTDIPLLQAVGKPIAFNPNMELIKVAKKKGWTTIVERKDVIYKIIKAELVKY